MAFPQGKNLSLIMRGNQNLPSALGRNPPQFLGGEEVAAVLATMRPLNMGCEEFWGSLRNKGSQGNWLQWGTRFEHDLLMDILYVRLIWNNPPHRNQNNGNQAISNPHDNRVQNRKEANALKFNEHQVEYLISGGEDACSVMRRARKDKMVLEQYRTANKPRKGEKGFFKPELCFSTEEGAYRLRPVFTVAGEWSVYLGRIKNGAPKEWMFFKTVKRFMKFLLTLKQVKQFMNVETDMSIQDISDMEDNLLAPSPSDDEDSMEA